MPNPATEATLGIFDLYQETISAFVPAMWAANGVNSSMLIQRIVDEIDEVEAGLNLLESSKTNQGRVREAMRTGDELNDIRSFMASADYFLHKRRRQQYGRYSPNGEGRHSTIVDRMKQVALEIHDPRAMGWLICLASSLDGNLPVPHAGLLTFQSTLDKVLANYPPELLGRYDQNGMVLNDAQLAVRFNAQHPMLRKLRRNVFIREGIERPLRRRDWWSLRSIFLAAHLNPALALQKLDDELARMVPESGYGRALTLQLQ